MDLIANYFDGNELIVNVKEKQRRFFSVPQKGCLGYRGILT